jgi:hypothetical protein
VLAFLDDEAISVEHTYNNDQKILSIKAIDCPNSSMLKIILQGVKIERFESNPLKRVERLIRHAKLPTLVKQQFMRRLPELMVSPLNIFDIAHTFTKSQLLAIYESLQPASPEKPAQDLDSAFETMLFNLRKIGIS